MRVALNKFGGMLPGIAQHLLPEHAATVATNCKLLSGALKAWKEPLEIATLSKGANTQGLFYYDNTYWFHWLNAVQAVKGPIASDSFKRIYYCDSGPKMTANDVALTGTNHPAVAYDLGVPQPATAPAVAVQAATAPVKHTITAIDLVGDDYVATSAAHGVTVGTMVNVTLFNSGFASLDNQTITLTALTTDTLKIGVADVLRKKITAITKANPAVVTAASHTLRTADRVILSVNGMDELHAWEGPNTKVNANKVSLDGVNSTAYGTFTSGELRISQRLGTELNLTLTDINNANPAKATCTAHGLKTGDVVTLDVTGMIEVDGIDATVTVVDANNFTLNDIDSRDYEAFVSGTAVRALPWWQLPNEATDVVTDTEVRSYVYTYLTKYGEEGIPSPVSTLINVAPGESVFLSGMAVAPVGNTVITHKRIYRTNTGSSGTEYQLVATVTIATTSYTDSIASESLGIVLESAEYNVPPSDLAGLLVLPNGSLCGYSGSEVCFSEPYKPHAWPLRYRVPVENTIKAVGAFLNNVLVTTVGLPYLLTGEVPGAMSRDKLEIGQACVSSRGMVDMGYSLLYPGVDGLIQVGQGKFQNVTSEIMTRDEWQAYTPSSIHAYLWNGKYLAFYNNGAAGAFLFDPEGQHLTHLSITATGGYSDPATGSLYLIIAGKVCKFDAGAAYLSYTWEGKPIITSPMNFGAARVYADTYPVTMSLYASLPDAEVQALVAARPTIFSCPSSGLLKFSKSVADSEPFRLPGGYLSRKWIPRLEGSVNVNLLLLSNDISEMKL